MFHRLVPNTSSASACSQLCHQKLLFCLQVIKNEEKQKERKKETDTRII